MSYIAPNSDIQICKGVPLDKDYNHTLYNTSKSNQYNAFYPYIKYNFTAQSYQRYGRNVLRIDALADNLYDCNYMMFRNTNFGNKWFYAFITKVEYVNNNCTAVEYEIDEMQTWYFDYEMGECFVEREHTETDVIGENLVDEDVQVGDLIPEKTWQYIYPDNTSSPSIMYHLLVFYVPNNTKKAITGETVDPHTGYSRYSLTDVKNPDGDYSTGEIVDGVYMGCRFWDVAMMVNTAAEADITETNINNLIATILGQEVQGQIINIVQVPTEIFNQWIVQHGTSYVSPTEIVIPITNNPSSVFFNSNHTAYYTPKNKKLYTAPYKTLVASNNLGQIATYRWECFSDPQECTFNISGVPIPSPEVMCYPTGYRGILKDYESGIVINDFPQPPWSEDSFAKWWSENRSSYVTSLISTAIMAIGTIGLTVATGGAAAPAASTALTIAGGTLPPAAASTAASTSVLLSSSNMGNLAKMAAGAKVASLVSQYKHARNTPDQISGQVNVSSLRTVQKRVGFKFYDMGVEMDRAKTIDNYFTMFGYAVKKVKRPNVYDLTATLRPHWNYIKTAGCILHSVSAGGGLPAGAEENIAQIYDKGITFWKNLSEIGNYSLDNSPGGH